jgi:hypothetical protein
MKKNECANMSNSEFVNHLMEGYSKHGVLVQMVIMDCIQRGLHHYISNKDKILEKYNETREDGGIPLINMNAWVECCEETWQRIEDKYNG